MDFTLTPLKRQMHLVDLDEVVNIFLYYLGEHVSGMRTVLSLQPKKSGINWNKCKLLKRI